VALYGTAEFKILASVLVEIVSSANLLYLLSCIMNIELNTDFEVPLWRFFESPCITGYDIPYTVKSGDKEHHNFICIIQLAWHYDEELLLAQPECMSEERILSIYGTNHIICLANTEQVDAFRKHRPALNICLANHNAFIDETLYNIDYTQEISNDLFVSSAFMNYKNLDLIHDIDNVCATGYYGCPGTGDGYAPLPSSVKKVLNFEDGVDRVPENWRWVSPKDIVKAINSSKIGGIFSTCEGACFSSSEYLLCGIPVLSCKAKGGREIWYNEDNCELCDPDNSSIREALGRMLSKYDKGEYDREAIRNRHIELMGVHRKNLGDAILDVMKKIVHTDELPSVEEIVESVKYYHSNNRRYEYTHGYKRQTKRQWDAERVLHPTV